ncbi:hypothetical protein ACWCQW_03865 [Streptomyces mirabilis]
MTVPVDTLRRPRSKPGHQPYRTIEGNVRIGSVIHGIGAEIEDPQGWVWTLVETMDGTREPSAVVGEVLRAHPELPAHERRAVRAYSVVLVVGTTLCLAFLATVTLPADITLFARAVAHLGPGHSAAVRLDATAVVVAPGGVHVLWARTWWRDRHGRRSSQPVVPAGRPGRSS